MVSHRVQDSSDVGYLFLSLNRRPCETLGGPLHVLRGNLYNYQTAINVLLTLKKLNLATFRTTS